MIGSGEIFKESFFHKVSCILAVLVAFAGFFQEVSSDFWVGLPDHQIWSNSTIYLVLAALIYLGSRFAALVLFVSFVANELIYLQLVPDLQSGILYLVVALIFLLKTGIAAMLLCAAFLDIRALAKRASISDGRQRVLMALSTVTVALVILNIIQQVPLIR